METAVRYLTTEEVAQELRVRPETVRDWRKSGNQRGPKSFRINGRVLYAREDVDAFIDAARHAERVA